MAYIENQAKDLFESKKASEEKIAELTDKLEKFLSENESKSREIEALELEKERLSGELGRASSLISDLERKSERDAAALKDLTEQLRKERLSEEEKNLLVGKIRELEREAADFTAEKLKIADLMLKADLEGREIVAKAKDEADKIKDSAERAAEAAFDRANEKIRAMKRDVFACTDEISAQILLSSSGIEKILAEYKEIRASLFSARDQLDTLFPDGAKIASLPDFASAGGPSEKEGGFFPENFTSPPSESPDGDAEGGESGQP